MALIQLPHQIIQNIPLPGAPLIDSIVHSKPAEAVTGAIEHKADDVAVKDEQKNPDAREFLKATGWPDAEIENAAAVMYRESRGKCDATHHNSNGTWDKGLFQINDVWVPSVIADKDRLDCNKGSAAALEIFNKSGWGPWYSSGCTGAPSECSPAPKGFKLNGTASSKETASGDAKDSLSGPLGAISDALNAVTNFIAQIFNADTWFRIGKVVLGGIVLVMAIEVFLNKSGATDAMAKTAGSFATGAVGAGGKFFLPK